MLYLFVIVPSSLLLVCRDAFLSRFTDLLETIELGSHHHFVYHFVKGLYSKIGDFELDGEDRLCPESHAERGFFS